MKNIYRSFISIAVVLLVTFNNLNTFHIYSSNHDKNICKSDSNKSDDFECKNHCLHFQWDESIFFFPQMDFFSLVYKKNISQIKNLFPKNNIEIRTTSPPQKI